MARSKLIARAKHVARARLELAKAIPTTDEDTDRNAALFKAEALMHEWLAQLPEPIRREIARSFQPGQVP